MSGCSARNLWYKTHIILSCSLSALLFEFSFRKSLNHLFVDGWMCWNLVWVTTSHRSSPNNMRYWFWAKFKQFARNVWNEFSFLNRRIFAEVSLRLLNFFSRNNSINLKMTDFVQIWWNKYTSITIWVHHLYVLQTPLLDTHQKDMRKPAC